ncbi:cytochrome p450 1a2 [Lecanosticta acicola]|uniref:Cytochrome p450 1a2 n=1 Tax=Lecanosticta acicola TaxID=111012 RepID=A0AAI9E8D1_9PEZI|nr:cytochrome p450 1a2 [Lecanosticta acicola]
MAASWMLLWFVAAVACTGYLCSLLLSKRPRHRLPLPPAPPGEPILGHLRVVPVDNPEYAYAKWSQEYDSDIIYVSMLGQPVIVLNSLQAAIELLDKRGANYCDRPRFVLFEVMGWQATLTFLRWGPKFKLHRKVLQRAFTPTSCVKYRSLQEQEAKTLLRGILNRPEEWETILRRFATAIVLGIGFGVPVKTDDDPYIKIATDASYALGHGGAPAGTPVDFFPILKYVPDIFARCRSLKFARDWRWSIRAIHDVPFAAVQADFRAGRAQPSFLSTLLQQQALQADSDVNCFTTEDIKGAAGAIFAAGQDTTWSTLVVFILNMVLHPEIQTKAQELLDQVVGPHRLPTFEDRSALPYIDYIVQETLRWGPVSPIGVPHRSLEDDEYEGMFIPKGSFVYANARAMTHDRRVYSQPEEFNPDRFLPRSEGGAGEPFPVGQFGFGRRVCVGRHLAEASVWIVIATLLATSRMDKALDADGKAIVPGVELTNGLTSHPKPFKCSIVPRSEAARALILSSSTH